MSERWDIIVIGAGPAGSLAAREAALAGAGVLLVERKRLPREKVCGCCVNGAALASLEAAGLRDRIHALGGERLKSVHLTAGGRTVHLPLPGGLSVSRAALDQALANAAVESGVTLRDGCSAQVQVVTDAEVHVRLDGSDALARVVVVADGLQGRSLDALQAFTPTVAPKSHMGIGTILSASVEGPAPGIVRMACGRAGYVGMVRLEDGRLDVAAALSPGFVRRCVGPGAAAARLLAESGAHTVEALTSARWQGVGQLTRRRAVAGRRILVVGDATGYVEPFTGEGIAWALASGLTVAPLAVAGAQSWDDAVARQWRSRHRRVVRQRQWLCRGVAWTLRHPALLSAAVGLLRPLPALARPALRAMARPGRLPTPEGVA